MSTELNANPIKIAIVGMTGSGKTVLVTTLAVKMAQMSIRDVYMGPAGEHKRQTLRYTQDNWQALIDGQWPPSTPAGELIQLQWELNTRNCQASVQFLDCAGQDIRSLFNDEVFNPASLSEDLRKVYDSVNSANVLIFLVNMKDLLATSDSTTEILDLDQMLSALQQRKDIPRRAAVAFSQYDKYKPEVDQKFNGDFLEYVRYYLPYLYGQYKRFHKFELIPVAAVNDTQNVVVNGEVKQYPAPNFSSYNLETLIHWIADSVEELAPEIENQEKFKDVFVSDEQPKPAIANQVMPSGEFASFSELSIPGTAAGERKCVFVNDVEFGFRWCPPGEFTMKTAYLGFSNHVTLTKGFWMMETEVTQRQWKAVMGYNPSDFKGDDLPVENVSWNDCERFCQKCARLGLPLQLPTEAQWEYACKAGSAKFKGDLNEVAWYKGNSNEKTHPVGTKKPNKWGLYDMRGNVCEWCSTRISDLSWLLLYIPGLNIILFFIMLLSQIMTPFGFRGRSLTDPTGSPNGSMRVIRGSGFSFYAPFCRSDVWFNFNETTKKLNVLGFRCVMNPKE